VKARVGWKALKASEYVDDGFAFLSTPNIKNKDIDFKNANYITYERYVESPEIKLKEDDILLVKDGSTLGIVNIVTYLPRETTVNSSIGVLRFNKTVFNKYLFYQIESKYIQDKIQLKKGGMGVPHLFQQDINNFVIIAPQFDEQKAIANYLDTKTAQIDRKIDLLTQKTTKYCELKQSLINETVTRGLDKTVVMKDSGVEWIGEVPAHWEIYRCKDLVDYYKYYPIGDGDHGSIKPEMYVETGIPYIRVQNLSWNGKISLENIAYITEDVHKLNKKSRLLIDDILVAKTGATVGKLGLITVEIKEANTTSSVGKITVNKKCFNPRFILYSFMAESFQKQIWITASQKSAQPGFNIDQFIFFTIACPKTKVEQKAITDYLDTKTAHIDRIIETINTQIDKLKELRKTLINDVVTGKIKVTLKGGGV
jgi:type I restriction enzyme, S subunit